MYRVAVSFLLVSLGLAVGCKVDETPNVPVRPVEVVPPIEDPALPATFSCPPVDGKSLTIVTGSAEWQSSVNLCVVCRDTTTTFLGSIPLDLSIPDVSAEDTLSLLIIFTNPLVISDTVPPFVSVRVSSGTLQGCPGEISYVEAQDNEEWPILSGSGEFYSSSCKSPLLQGFQYAVRFGPLEPGERLTCLTTRFVVPRGFVLAPFWPGQTVPVTSLSWFVTYKGDRSMDPPPVHTE